MKNLEKRKVRSHN